MTKLFVTNFPHLETAPVLMALKNNFFSLTKHLGMIYKSLLLTAKS